MATWISGWGWRTARGRAGLGILACLFAVVLVRTAWLCDDAYITLRTVDNFVRGYGLTWNVVERVQAYTHPLWMFLLTAGYFFTREAFLTTLAICALCSLAAFALLLRAASSPGRALAAGLVLVSSKAFTDYSTAGLENPLSHLLLALLILDPARDRPAGARLFFLSLGASLLALNRLDLLALVLPLYAGAVWDAWRRAEAPRRTAWAGLLLGWLPLVAWEVFSVVYYGFPVPNTAYAKLKTGVAASRYVEEGLRYFVRSFQTDPVTVLALAAGLVLLAASRDRRERLMAAGAAFYLVYVVKIGGDFMNGRLLTPPLFWILLGVAHGRAPASRLLVGAAALAALGLAHPLSPLRSGRDYPPGPPVRGDERAHYYQVAGLLTRAGKPLRPVHEDYTWGLRMRALTETGGVMVVGLRRIGFDGYAAGPQFHGIDSMGLAEPLLARLDALAVKTGECPIGHFEREIPLGYPSATHGDPAQIRSPSYAQFYARLRTITRGPLFTRERFATIWRMNTGRYQHLVKKGAAEDQIISQQAGEDDATVPAGP